MATSVMNASLTVVISESINLNNNPTVRKTTLVIQDVDEVMHRVVSVPTSVTTYITTAVASAGGQFVLTDIKYIRVTNLDSVNFLTLGLIDTSGDTAYIKLEAGQTFMIHNDDIEAFTNGSEWAAYSQWDKLTLMANTATVDAEIFVANA